MLRINKIQVRNEQMLALSPSQRKATLESPRTTG